MEKLESENVPLEFQVQSLIKERENVKSEYQKLFDSIKKTRTQTQGEINELIEHLNQKTYAYAEVRAHNQDLLITISELKDKLKKDKKGKSVNTKFDKTSVCNQLLCVTPLYKQVFQKKTVAPKTEEKYVLSKIVTLQTSPNKEKDVETNQNVIAPGMYKVTKQQEPNTKRVKSVLPSTGLSAASIVRRPLNIDSPLKNSIVTDLDVQNALKAKDILCVSCANNLEDTTPVVSKTRFSIKISQSESLDTTSVVSKTKIAAVTPLRAKNKVVQIVLWIVDSGCSKHMTGDRSLLKNFVKKFMGTVRFGNDHFAAIAGYGDYVQGNITVCHVYYVEGLGHNLFSVGQFCDGDLEVAFRFNTCYVRNLEGDDLLTGARVSNLYTISISDMAASSPVCLLDSTKSEVISKSTDMIFVFHGGDLDNSTSNVLIPLDSWTSGLLVYKLPLSDFDGNTVFVPYDAPNFEEVESSTTALDPSNMHDWIESIQDELHQVERLDVWELVPRPDEKNIIAVKWL
ncbi:hypothetical protein Tco_0609263 [Tanacetum coccineum]